MKIVKTYRWMVACCITLGLLICGCEADIIRAGDLSYTPEPARTKVINATNPSLPAMEDHAQLIAFMGDILFTDRYGVQEETLKMEFSQADIGTPVIIAKTRNGEGIVYMPLLEYGRMMGVSTLSIRDGRMSFRGVTNGEAFCEAMFAVTREGLEKRLQMDGKVLSAYAFIIDPVLYGEHHDTDRPLCQVETTNGERLFYLYEKDVFVTASKLYDNTRTTNR